MCSIHVHVSLCSIYNTLVYREHVIIIIIEQNGTYRIMGVVHVSIMHNYEIYIIIIYNMELALSLSLYIYI